MLAKIRRDHPGALYSDFRRYYQLNSLDIGQDISLLEASWIMAYLPADCAWRRALNKDTWPLTEQLLGLIHNNLSYILASLVNDPSNIQILNVPGQNQEKQTDSKPSSKSNVKQVAELESMPVDELLERLSRPRVALEKSKEE